LIAGSHDIFVVDFSAKDSQAFPHEGSQRRPAFCGDHGAVDMNVCWREVDVGTARQGHLRLAGTQRPHRLPAHDTVDRNEDLYAMAYREDRLLRLVKMAHESLNALIGSNVFRSAAASAIHGIVFLRFHLGERLVDYEIVPEFFGLGLVSFEVMQ
jgi:hypothetical protein